MTTTTYAVTTDKKAFRVALVRAFPGREILTIMSVVNFYHDALESLEEKDSLYVDVDYDALCADAQEDGVTPEMIARFLKLLSVSPPRVSSS